MKMIDPVNDFIKQFRQNRPTGFGSSVSAVHMTSDTCYQYRHVGLSDKFDQYITQPSHQAPQDTAARSESAVFQNQFWPWTYIDLRSMVSASHRPHTPHQASLSGTVVSA